MPNHEPIRLNPDNRHYFLFRGTPTILITSAEHYVAVINLDFDSVRRMGMPVPKRILFGPTARIRRAKTSWLVFALMSKRSVFEAARCWWRADGRRSGHPCCDLRLPRMITR